MKKGVGVAATREGEVGGMLKKNKPFYFKTKNRFWNNISH